MGYYRQPWRLPHRQRKYAPGLHVPGSVYNVASATTADVLAMAEDHYGVSTLDALALKLDPEGRDMEGFCQGWWGKPYAESIHEILMLDRFMQWIRQASRRQNPFSNQDFPLNYFGGDCLDSVIATSADAGRRYYIGSDYLISIFNMLDLGTNISKSSTLPNRNYIINEFKDGEVDSYGRLRTADGVGAGFRAQQGANATTYVTPNQTTYPSTLYWPIAMSPSPETNFIVYIFAWLVQTESGGHIDHEILDNHILHINLFGTVSTTSVFDIGAAGNFFIDDVMEDTGFRYVFGRKYNPPIGNFSPSYYENMDTDWFEKKVARIAEGTSMTLTGHTGTVYDNYEWWTGSGWSNDRSLAASLLDNVGNPVRSMQGIAKLGTDSYVGLAQAAFENQKRVYLASAPQGPWWHFANVPCPPYGRDTHEPGLGRHGDFCKIYTDIPARSGHAMTWCTDLAWQTTGPAYNKTGKHIVDADTPYPREIPTEPGPLSTSPPSNVHRMRPLLVR